MSNLEKLVPQLELCKQIPAGEFADCALMWLEVDIPQGNKTEWRVIPSYKIFRTCHNPKYPAPTLREIMMKVASDKDYKPSISFRRDNWMTQGVSTWEAELDDCSVWKWHDMTPEETALRMYLNIRGINLTMPCPRCGNWLQRNDGEVPIESYEGETINVSEYCPKCNWKYYDKLYCWVYDGCAIDRNFKYVFTPMGNRWIKRPQPIDKPSDPSETSDPSDK